VPSECLSGQSLKSDPIPDPCVVNAILPCLGADPDGQVTNWPHETALQNESLENCAVLQRLVAGIIPFGTKCLQSVKSCATAICGCERLSFERQTIINAPRKFALHQNKPRFQSF
jgi:hypothetical protein